MVTCQPQKRPDDVLEAIEQCEEIIATCQGEEGELPEAAEDFAIDVEENCRGVLATIRQQNRVTENQQRALDNWQAGLMRWIERGR